MEKKLFVFDMDGTLLNSQRLINESSLDVLNEIVEMGHDVVIATGRNFCQLDDELKVLPKKIKYVITVNGGIINNLETKEIDIIAKPIDKVIIDEIVRTAQMLKRELQWSNEKIFHRVYFGQNAFDEIDDKNFFSPGFSMSCYCDWDKVKDTLYNQPIYHMAIKCEKKFILEQIPRLREMFETKDMCTITETSKTYLDCDSLNINKYNALKKVQQLLGHTNDSTYAFGDSSNDYLMVKNVGNGVAMGNARDDLKQVAKHVIGDNDSDAIANFLRGVISA